MTADAVVLERADTVVTFDEADRVLRDADVVIERGRITAVDAGAGLAAPDDAERIDARGWIVTPGLVNAHQHITQVGFRSMVGYERSDIGPWLGELGRRVRSRADRGLFGPDAVQALATAGFTESVVGGTTTVAEQHYHWPGGHRATGDLAGAIIAAADAVGSRLRFGRGCITLGADHGGTAHPAFVEELDDVLDHCSSLIDEHHRTGDDSHISIDLAPCGVHVDRPETFVETAALAADHDGVGLHTHLYESVDTAFAVDHYGTTAWEVLADNGWAQPRTWLAHMVDPPLEQIPEFAAADVGVIHLVAPDLRMGWGLAPLRHYLDHGCRTGFGTTGSASNDGANVLGDLRVAALAHRQDPDPTRWPTCHELLRLATRGSAEAIGRTELGRIEAGAQADIAAWDMTTVDRVGIDDPVVGLVLSGLSDRAVHVLIAGRSVVRDGRCVTVDEASVAAAGRAAAPNDAPTQEVSR